MFAKRQAKEGLQIQEIQLIYISFLFFRYKRLPIRTLRVGQPNMIFFIHDYNTRNLLSRLDVLLRESLSLHIGSDRVLGACF